MHRRHNSPEPCKWSRRMNPGTRSDVQTSASSTPSTSAHVRTGLLQSNQSVRSTVASRAKKSKRNRANRAWTWKRFGFKGRMRLRGSKRPKKKRRSGRSTLQPQSTQQSSNSADQIQTGQQISSPQSISEQDITSCQWLYYGAHIGNETRNIEFKVGGGSYMQHNFCQHVCVYASAFLNSGGGSLVVGVNDSGMVRGLYFSHEEEDKTRLQVDRNVRLIHPPLLPHQYSLRFLPVVKPGVEEHCLKVLCLTFRAPPVFNEPTLYQTDQGKVYMRRDGSVEGPLANSVILEWSKHMWIGKVQQLEKCLRTSRTDIHRLRQLITPLYHIIASLQEQQRTTPPRSSSSSPSSAASPVRPPVGSPYVRPAHNSRAPDLALESPPPPEHRQM
ncbi:schlafen-like protein 1 isoform X1 [Thunnus albacares]|uniref:schlafen-like protein 1 isoform X1 n=1 Tax=Thunnus albacares TaxID=8236 RepID=UPI001CF68148|nr:schlafen-like protein 1 isoform X1 [Thunnus albacares]